MPKLVIVPNNMKSKGAKALAQVLSDKLGYKVYRVKESSVRRRVAFKLSPGTDKLTQLNRFNQNEIEHPEYTSDINVARGWITTDGATVMCRTLLRGSEGRGIVVASNVDQLVPCRLYTRYVPKKEEYRVHVFNGSVIDVQQKRKKRGFEDDRNTKIRNVVNGYVFCRDGIVEPTGLRDTAVKATASLGYSVGAVDVAYNVKKEKLVVLEVNANPGMQGTTLERYADAIIRQHKGRS
jgi:hypothetical protein